VREGFLEARITAEALLAKLVDVLHQHEMLVLRPSLQMNLRHLQRSPRSDDLEHLWNRLVDTLANSVGGVRGAMSPAPLPALDDALIALPIKLGGLGIPSFKMCSPLAYAEDSEASDASLASLHGQDTDTLSHTEHRRPAAIRMPAGLQATILTRSDVSLVTRTTNALQWVSLLLTDFGLPIALTFALLHTNMGGLQHCGHQTTSASLG
jgi:hypothetical protein